MSQFTARIVAALTVVAASVTWFVGAAPPAAAHHAGETVTLSRSEGLNDGDTVTVSFTNFAAGGKPVKLVIAGQGRLVTIPDKLNFDEYAAAPEVTVNADGSGSGEIVAIADHGTVRDGTTLDCRVQQCWVVAVQEPFLPEPYYATAPIYFSGGSVAPSTSTPPDTGAPSTESSTTPTSTTPTSTTPTSTTTSSSTTSTTTTTSEKPVDDEESDPKITIEEDGGSGLVFGMIGAGVLVAAAGGAVVAKKRRDTQP